MDSNDIIRTAIGFLIGGLLTTLWELGIYL